ncbi:uncharacterized protein HaLaN_13454 [Haematococcus lacustris]|uniref:Uncharacterized protein n=1 Tax=Haematococcus lacustris TaxID=44745 RepID=A0A699ZMA8_HAELA|nr:uncharacterized protein HaLaN_13454 [Haematococcus lacustris]
MKWYMACSRLSLLTGGSTPNASQHSRMITTLCLEHHHDHVTSHCTCHLRSTVACYGNYSSMHIMVHIMVVNWDCERGCACYSLRVGPNARNACVADVVNGVAGASVLRQLVVVEVHYASSAVEPHVLQDCAKADGLVDALGIAAALDVEHAAVAPAVLVVADQRPTRVRGQRGLASACDLWAAWPGL